jgi:hypothetical protein
MRHIDAYTTEQVIVFKRKRGSAYETARTGHQGPSPERSFPKSKPARSGRSRKARRKKR